MNLKLTDEQKQHLLRRGPGPGHWHFTCCPTCGHLEWRMTQNNEPDDVTVQEDTMGRGCAMCQDVAQRSPEIFQWVLNTINYQHRRREP